MQQINICQKQNTYIFFTLSGIKNSFSAKISTKFRSSRQEVFCKKVFLETPQNCQILLFRLQRERAISIFLVKYAKVIS